MPWAGPPALHGLEAAFTYALLEDWDAFLTALERSVAERAVGMELDGLDPLFDPLRGTPADWVTAG